MKRSTLSKISIASCFVLVSGCAGMSTLTETALPIIERFPFGHVLDAAKEAYCAVSKCNAPALPLPVPQVKP